MTKVEKIYEKEKEEAVNEAVSRTEKSKVVEIAKNMLLDGEDIKKIVRYINLNVEEINKLKEILGL